MPLPFRGYLESRMKAKSAGYGKTSVVVKPPPEPQSFTFKPDLSSGLNKKTTEKREAAKGSNYGKVCLAIARGGFSVLCEDLHSLRLVIKHL